MRAERARCSACGRSRPADETVLIPGHRQGSYNRAGARTQRRVCRDCTEHRVAFVRGQQEQRLSTSVNEHSLSWEYAARHFDIDISGLMIDRMTGRKAP